MSTLGKKIAARRRELGLTQTAFAESLYVTRQTVGRWEQGAATPDIETVVRIANLLQVSCDYLLRDDVPVASGTDAGEALLASDDALQPAPVESKPVSRLLEAAKGRTVKLGFFYNEYDPDLMGVPCTILDIEGSMLRVSFKKSKKAEPLEKLLALASIQSMTFVEEG